MDRSQISEKHKEILNFIEQEISLKGYPPSVREIGSAVGLNSSSTVHGHLRKLEKLGFLTKDPSKNRAISLAMNFTTSREIESDMLPNHENAGKTSYLPLVGVITAGQPILAVESIEQYYPFPEEMLPAGDKFLLKIRGDSMINAGILDGDTVIIRKQSDANDRDIVAAMVNEEDATIKTLRKQGGQCWLQPENDALEPIFPENLWILGKLVGLFRTL